MRLGILGGTFDPIHIGHLMMAEEARVYLKLDRILCLPTGQPWMRQGTNVSPAEHRVGMVLRATRTNPDMELSLLEVERPGDTYTIDTLRAIREQSPEAELYFILGLDSLTQFHRWKEPNELLKLCTIAVQARPGYPEYALAEAEAGVPGLREALVWLAAPPVGVSSTEIRKRVAQGQSIRYMVLPEVEEYIKEEGLYRENAE
jgi:nicotinate-nucleotide adenylyltransferase